MHLTARDLMPQFLPPKHTTVRAAMSVSPQPDLVEAYDGARVRITGFAVPFDNEAPPCRRLLPVPFSGACVKFPPPPVAGLSCPAGSPVTRPARPSAPPPQPSTRNRPPD
jgi:hypothetical protein